MGVKLWFLYTQKAVIANQNRHRYVGLVRSHICSSASPNYENGPVLPVLPTIGPVDVCILPDIISLHWCHYQVPTNTFNRPSEAPKLWCALICQKAFCTKSLQHQRELPNVFAGGDQEWLMRPGRKVPPHLATSRGMKATLPNSFFARPMKKFHRSQQFQFSDFSLPLPIASPSASFSLFVCALVCLCASSFVCVFVSLMRMWIFFSVILHWPFPAIFLFILVLSTTIQNFYTLMWKMSVWHSST